MINNLNLEITKIINKKRKYIPQDVIESDLINLLILKYLCDTNIYTYKDIIKLNYIENREVKYESRTISFSEPEIKSLLPLIEYEDITSLVKDYLSALNIGINFIDSNEKKVCISADYTTNLYDPTGNTTYIINGFKQNIRRIIWFKFFDEVLKVNNEYIPYAELDITKYTKLYIHDFAPKYRFIRNSSTDLYDLIRNMIYRNKNLDIILHTPYKKISNMNEAWYLLSYLNTVILYDERDTYLIFKFRKSDNEDVSIINYDNFKDKTIKKLHFPVDFSPRLAIIGLSK